MIGLMVICTIPIRIIIFSLINYDHINLIVSLISSLDLKIFFWYPSHSMAITIIDTYQNVYLKYIIYIYIYI